MISQQVEIRGDKDFLIWEPLDGTTERFTYKAFFERCAEVAAGLQRSGLQPSDVLLLHMSNRPEFLIYYFACAMTGVLCVTTNSRYSADELSFALEHSQAKVAVTEEALLPAFAGAETRVETIYCDGDMAASGDEKAASLGIKSWDELQGSIDFEPVQADPMRELSVQYTSGTTGRPKGVVFTHANMLWTALTVSRNFQLGEDDIAMTVFPLYHVNALGYSVMGTLWSGGTLVLQPRFSASRYWDVVTRNACTWSSVNGFVATALSEHPVPEHTLRYWPIGVGDLTVFENKFNVRLIGFWGMTETISHGVVSFPHLRGRQMAIGMVAPEYELSIRDESGRELTPSEDGVTGRVYLRGVPGLSLFKEYLRDPEATRKAVDSDGWLDTGDRITAYADGSLVFSDRDKDMLRVGSENVAASEVERVVMGVSGVREAAVVGKPDKLLEEVPVAFVLTHRTDKDELIAEILAVCGEKLSDFKRPREVICLEEFPRANLDKVSKKQLRELLGESND